MLKISALLIGFFATISLNAQNAQPYALWQDQGTNDYYFVRIDASSGIKSDIALIPGLSHYVVGSTAFNSDKNHFYFIGMVGATAYLYTINVLTGAVISSPIFSDAVVGIEYNNNDSLLYGIKIIGNNYELVTIDPGTSTSSPINSNLNIQAYVGETFTIDLKKNLYIFTALVGSSFYLQAYSLINGNLVYNNIFPDNLAGYQYSCVDSSVFALWENGNLYQLRKVDVNSGTHTLVATLNGVTPGYYIETASVNQFGEFVYRGFDSLNASSIITIDISNGTVSNIVASGVNAFGFEEPQFCVTTTSISEPGIYTTKIYPNPSNSLISVKSQQEIYEYRIYSLTGKPEFIKTISAKEFIIDLSGLNAGVYILNLRFKNETGGNDIIQKIIKY